MNSITELKGNASNQSPHTSVFQLNLEHEKCVGNLLQSREGDRLSSYPLLSWP